MESRTARVSFNKAGNNSLTPRVILPIKWIREMGLTEDNREIEIIFEDDKTIRIKPLDK